MAERLEGTVALITGASSDIGAATARALAHSREEVRQQVNQRFLFSIEPLAAEDIAEAIAFIVTRPRSVAVNELLVRPTEQDWAS